VKNIALHGFAPVAVFFREFFFVVLNKQLVFLGAQLLWVFLLARKYEIHGGNLEPLPAK
jgi:hypothetical protein